MAETGRAALVTGAAKGIGKATAARLLRDGWSVLLVDRDAAAGRRTLAELSGGERVRLHPGDVGEEEVVQVAVAAAVQAFGRLDAVVSNAGIMITKPVTDLALDE